MNTYPEQSVICPVMIGRDLPTQALQRLFEQARDGQGRIALVSGEAGIGKSRLVRELKARLQPFAPLVLQGSCFEADQTLPYAPITDLLRTFFASLAPARKSAVLAGSGAPLVHLVPELAADFPDAPAASGDSEAEKRRLHETLAALLTSLSAAAPLLLIVEDIHWCDDASLDFLLFLARHLDRARVFLVLTYRDDEVGTALAQFLAQLDRGRLTTEFRLPRLTAETVGAMVRAIFSMERVPRGEFVDAVYTLSEGNPFFIEEMLKSLVAEGDIFLSDGRWERKPLEELRIPRTVQVSLRQRLQRLSPAARETLSLAAVAGRRFDFTLLQRLTNGDERGLLRIIRELIDAQFVVEESADRFAFRHALTRQAVYEELLARERRALHRVIAETIEQAYAGGARSNLSDLAYHYFQGEEWEKALDACWQAGQYAEALYAPRAALEHYGRALDAADHLQIAPPLPLLRARGKTLELTSNFVAARDDYLRMLQLARQSGERRSEWQSLLDLGFLYHSLDFAQSGRYFEEAIAAARSLDDPTALADSLNRLGNWYINQDLPLDALPYHREALAIYERLNDTTGRTETLDLLGVASVVAGDIVNSGLYYDQVIPLFRQTDNRVGLSSALAVTCCRGGNCMEETVYCPPTSVSFLLQYADEARQIANAIGSQHAEAAADMYASYGLVTQGEYELGLTFARRSRETAAAASHSLYFAASDMALGRIYNDLLAFETARATLEPALEMSRKMSAKFVESSIGGFLVSSYIGLAELNTAEQLIEALRTEPMQSVGQRIVRCAEAELRLAQGDSERALTLIDHLIETAPSSHGQVIPRLWQMKADALLASGKPDTSLVLLQEVVKATSEGELKALLWRSLISLGKVELLVGRRVQAEATLDSARDLLETLANKLSDPTLRQQFLARAHTLIPVEPPLTPRQAARLAYDGLTEREREIAVLIAEGKSSREIAGQLILSKRTIDAHTANILAKLNFSSRIQIARWVVEKGLR